MFLAFLALSILCSEGWIGPVTCLVALILPPEIKSFGVSLWSAVATVLIMPAGNVIFSIYLTVCPPASCTRHSAAIMNVLMRSFVPLMLLYMRHHPGSACGR